MRAIIAAQNGGPEVLGIKEMPDPIAGPDEIVIRIRAAGLNNADLLQRRGLYPPPPGASPLMGLEVAGEVVEIGAGATLWKKCDRVMALLGGGGYAEKVSVAETQALQIPSGFDFAQAAGIPEAFLTAWLELATLGQLKKGETVLIHAGASGVGTAAIQLARELGAHVYVTAGSPEKLERCRELGAELAINYKTEEFDERALAATAGRGVNCILDLVGAVHWKQNIRSLALDGRLLLVGMSGGSKTELELGPILSKRLRIIGSTLRGRTLDDKAALIRDFSSFALPLFSSGRLKPIIDRSFDWTDVASAHRYLETKANVGKVVIKMA